MSQLRVNTITNAGGTGSTYAPGHVVQVLQAIKTNVFTTSSSSYVDIPGLTITITPKSVNSKFLLTANIVATNTTGGRGAHIRFNGGNSSTFVGDAAGAQVRSAASGSYMDNGKPSLSYGITYLDSPNTSLPITYAIQGRIGELGVFNLNISTTDSSTADYGRPASSFTVMEIAQ
jgi:hypothetical protein